jgi:pimeloyl-ACP methyl ester carboxylesterase
VPFAELESCRVFYDERGAGEAVLLVSGLGAHHAVWESQVEALRGHYRVIVFDNPGIGETAGPPGPYSSGLLADVAAGLLGHLGIERAHVVGASMGGIVAQQLALRSPGLVASLSLHGTWARTDRYLAALTRSWQASARGLSRIDLCRQLWLSVFTVWWYNDRSDALAELERLVLENPDLQSAEQFCAQAEACIFHDVLDRLSEIGVPAYVSVGDRDLVTPAHHAYSIKERLPQARLRLWKEMGHAPYWEIPDEFNARQLEFLHGVD